MTLSQMHMLHNVKLDDDDDDDDQLCIRMDIGVRCRCTL
jgi:hypothetical protein